MSEQAQEQMDWVHQTEQYDDPRVPAILTAVYGSTRSGRDGGRAKEVADNLAVADKADAAAGIHRIKLDDDLVLRTARKIAESNDAEWVFDDGHGVFARSVRFSYIDQARGLLSDVCGVHR